MKKHLLLVVCLAMSRACFCQDRLFRADSALMTKITVGNNKCEVLQIDEPSIFFATIANDFQLSLSKLYYCSVDSVFSVFFYAKRVVPDSTGHGVISNLNWNLNFYNKRRNVVYKFWSDIKPSIEGVTIENIMSVSTQVLIDVLDSASLNLGQIMISRNRSRTRFLYPYFSYLKGQQKFASRRVELPIHTDLFLTTDLRLITRYMEQLDSAYFENKIAVKDR